jgi:WD40 repeat protein
MRLPLSNHPDYSGFRRLATLSSPNLNQIALTSDGKTIVGRDVDGKTVRFWDADTGALLRTVIADESSKHISVAKHGNTLIDLKNDGMVSLWNLSTDQPICTIDGREFEFSDWALSWNSQWFAGRNNNLVNVWQTETGDLVYQFSLVPDLPHRPESKSYYPKPLPRNTLAIRGDGKAIIAIVFGFIKVYLPETKRLYEFFRDEHNRFEHLWLAPEGTLLVATHSERTQLRVWQLTNGRSVFVHHETGCYRPIHSADITLDGQTLVFAEQTNLVDGFYAQAIDLTTSQEICPPIKAHRAPLSDIATNQDGTRVVTCSGQKHPNDKECDRSLRLWNLQTGNCLQVIAGCFEPTFLAVTADNQTLIAANSRGVGFWKLPSGEWCGEIAEYPWNYTAIALSPNRQKLVCSFEGVAGVWVSESSYTTIGGLSSRVEVWDVTAQQRLRHWDVLCAQTKVAISDDEDFTFSTASNTIRVIDRQYQERLLEGHQDLVTSLAPCFDHQTLVSGGKDGEIRLWNYQTGERIRRLLGHQVAVRSLLVTANQQHLISADEDGNIYIWDLQSGQMMRSLPGHTTGVHSLSFARDEQILISSSTDGTVIVWDWQNALNLHTFSAEGQPCYASTISPDGQFIIQGLRDELLIWGTPTSASSVTDSL